MDKWRQQYLHDCRLSPQIAFHGALMRRIPKKYTKHVVALIKAHPTVPETQSLETSMVTLCELWQCSVTDVRGLLKRMTAPCQDAMTYEILESEHALNATVRLVFNIPEAREESA
jgi:hypothetical protein